MFPSMYPRTNGRTYPVKFDRAIDEDLYVKFSISLVGGMIDTDALAISIVENVLFGLGENATGSTITGFIMTLNAKYQVTEMLVSKDGTTWLETVATDSKAGSVYYGYREDYYFMICLIQGAAYE